MVIPRSRSRSMESSSCARINLESTVRVSSRMRSASVDLPWSIWAMMQKLRMRDWSAIRVRLETTSQPAADEREDLRRFGQSRAHHREGVDGAAERQAGAHGGD